MGYVSSHVVRDYSTVTTVRTEICALEGFYTAQNGSYLPTFRVNLLVRNNSTMRNKQEKARI